MKLLCALALVALGLPFGSAYLGGFGGLGGWGGGLGAIFGPGAYPGFYGLNKRCTSWAAGSTISSGDSRTPPGIGAAERRGTLSPYPLDINTVQDPVTWPPHGTRCLRRRLAGAPRSRTSPNSTGCACPSPHSSAPAIPSPTPTTSSIPSACPYPVPIHSNTEVHKTDVVAATPGGPVLLESGVTGVRPGEPRVVA
uniref:20/24 kDa immunodominant saliva protein n=1 Tax=Rhipicephalus appendiculatus TaxID=34631 RepID=Q86GZ1_RHIAP|nr:20/24 kDa immunodominant saliva protein [Rhipicephalus appendiculatus]